jgi:hypothetical protein
MPNRLDRPLACLLLALACALASRCTEKRPAILIQETSISVENQSGEAWSGVEIWLNDHYRVTARTLEPGGRLVVPLDVFVAGYGQRFDRRRQAPFGIEVTAREGSGREVRLVWGKGRRR